MSGTIDANTFKFLKIESPLTPIFYVVPKVHKGVIPPPERPIISSCGSLTENVSRIIDEYLYPHIRSLFSLVKDTIELLKIIDGFSIPKAAWLVCH